MAIGLIFILTTSFHVRCVRRSEKKTLKITNYKKQNRFADSLSLRQCRQRNWLFCTCLSKITINWFAVCNGSWCAGILLSKLHHHTKPKPKPKSNCLLQWTVSTMVRLQLRALRVCTQQSRIVPARKKCENSEKPHSCCSLLHVCQSRLNVPDLWTYLLAPFPIGTAYDTGTDAFHCEPWWSCCRCTAAAARVLDFNLCTRHFHTLQFYHNLCLDELPIAAWTRQPNRAFTVHCSPSPITSCNNNWNNKRKKMREKKTFARCAEKPFNICLWFYLLKLLFCNFVRLFYIGIHHTSVGVHC